MLLGRCADTADVDGDNTLDFEELEMVVVAMDPHHDLTHEDMKHLWATMKAGSPDAAEGDSMNFNQFLIGMANVRKDERAKGWMDVNKPNKWELLSLLIDTPINKVEEKEILASLDSGLERMGIAMLKKQHQGAMEREHMRDVLNRAGRGELRKLDPGQVSRMKSLWTTAVVVSGFIGFAFTLTDCLVENLLVWHDGIAVDGAKDRYDICQVHSYIAPPANLSAPEGSPDLMPTMEIMHELVDENWLFLKCNVRPVNSSLVEYDELLGKTSYRGVKTTGDDGWYDSMKVQPRSQYYAHTHYEDFDEPAAPGGVSVAGSGNCLYDPELGRKGTWGDYEDIELPIGGATYSGSQARCRKCECEICGCLHHVNGDLLAEGLLSLDNPIIEFWAILGVVIGVNIVFEIALLMYYAVYYCVKVSWALDQRLVPLNKDRAFVADSLVRAAFELGNPDSPVLGVDPHTEQAGGGGQNALSP